jgi:hypothetical protein
MVFDDRLERIEQKAREIERDFDNFRTYLLKTSDTHSGTQTWQNPPLVWTTRLHINLKRFMMSSHLYSLHDSIIRPEQDEEDYETG